MTCYVANPETIARLRQFNAEKRKAPRQCPHCGVTFQHKNKKYCGPNCRRAYFAARFDRWIASPEQIMLPQCFDEFMLRNELPCLVLGCNWVGENLANHVNFAHGITADKFRELVGFNSTTGLVGQELRRQMSDRFKLLIQEGTIQLPTPIRSQESYAAPRTKGRLEGAEHRAKAMAIIRSSESAKPPLPCEFCQQPVEQPAFGLKKYCSVECRNAIYREAGKAELKCDHCGSPFVGLRAQVLRSQRGQKVCCSQECRNQMNIIACLATRNQRSTR